MEALCLTAVQPPLLRHRRAQVPGSTGTHFSTMTYPCNQVVKLTLSRARAEVSPAVHSQGKSSSLSSSSSFPDEVPSPPSRKVSPNSLQYPPGYLGAVPVRTVSEGNGDTKNAMRYLTNILSSKVYDVAIETPLEPAPKLSERLGINIFLKREDTQPAFSFKLRGAYNMMAKLTSEQLEKGVICSSAGNHAQGVALAAKKLGCSAVIAMPVTTREIKRQSVKRLGATVVLHGDSFEEAQAYAKNRAKEECRTFIPAFDHPDVITGQGTIGMEILRQTQVPLHAIFVPVGGGGLIAGIAAYVKWVSPEVKIIGVEPSDANAMALSLHHDERVMLDQVGGFADGVAIKEVGQETFSICKELVEGIVLVNREAICASIKNMFEEKRSILEPAGALALAGAEAYCKYYGLKGKNIVAITSGANMNFDALRTAIELTNGPGRVCVPIDPNRCDEFDPTTVPTLSRLLKELNMGSLREDAENKWDRTSLGDSVMFFRSSFLQPLLKSCKEEIESSYSAKQQQSKNPFSW
ncbi:hypothetical protein SLA2020_401940 [Shorea laevis]